MVITDGNIENMPPKERIRLLKKKRKKKKEELEKLMSEKEKELEETEKSLKEATENIDEEINLLKQEDDDLKEDSLEKNLEETISNEQIKPLPKGTITYESPLESISTPKNIYELTNTEVYNEVKRIEQKGYITSSEQHWLNEVKGQLNNVQNHYSQNEIDRIDNMYNSIPRIESVLKRLDEQLYNLNKSGDSLNAIYK